jgi:hypothetical protein
MKFVISLLIAAFSVTTTFGQSDFERLFEPKTLRIDFSLIGNDKSQSAAIERLREEPIWSGPRKNRLDPFMYGGYCVKVYDKSSGNMIFSRGFNTLFEEWRTTDQAKNETQSWCNTVCVPMPKNNVIVELLERNRKDGKFYTMLKQEIDPKSIFIDRSPLDEYPVMKAHYSGSAESKIDLVFLPEGYTLEEMEQFRTDVKRFTEALFSTAPFDKCKSDFNIWAVEVPSKESGTDISGKDVFKNTAFDSGFYTFGIDRYLTTSNMRAIRDAVWNVPCDAVFVLVNSEVYGGGGMYNFYAIGTARNTHTMKVFTHELGHSLAGLADEYFTSSVAYNDFYDLKVEPWEPNITTLVDFESKWKNMLPKKSPIPTPADKEHKTILGVYEGGGYVAKGIYRPMIDCMMRNNQDFCPVCSRAILRMVDYLTDKRVK